LKLIFQSNELIKKDKYIIADEAFNLCINELIRQISFDCLERGELTTMIWRNYLKLFNKIIAFELKEKEKFQDQKETEFLKYSKMYKEQLDEKDKIISQQKVYNEDILQEICSLKAEISQWKKNEQKNVEQTEKMKKISEQLFMKGKKLKHENEEIRFKLSKYRDESQKSRVFKKNATMTRMFESQTSFVPLNEEDSDKEFNNELEDQQLKDIMKLLGEDESENEENNKKNKDLENPIIIKCFQEQKEKILLVKSTEIDLQIRDSFFTNKGVQTELNLIDKKFDPILIKENLDENINERIIKKNLLQFKVDTKRESIKKFTDVVTEIQRRKSVVVELLNCISPPKQPKLSILGQTNNSKISANRIEIQNNSSQDNSNSVDSSRLDNKEIVDKIKINSLEKNDETIEIKIELPSKAKTILEKRNSLILELSKKIVKDYDGKSSVLKKNESEKGKDSDKNNIKLNFNFENNEIATNTYYFPPPKNIKIDKKELSQINASTEENISERKKNDDSKQTIIPILLLESPKSSEDPINMSQNEKKEGSLSGFGSPKPNDHNQNFLSSSQNIDKFIPIKLKSKRNISEKDYESSKNKLIKMKTSTLIKQSPAVLKQSTKLISDFQQTSHESLRQQIKEQKAADFLSNYLGSNLDKILENSNDKQPISVKIPKEIVSNFYTSQRIDQPLENEINPNENNEEEELRNKIVEIIQMFQIETQKNDDLMKLQEELKIIIFAFVDIIKKILNYVKEKSLGGAHQEKYEEFNKAFLDLRSKIPKNFDLTYEQELKEIVHKRIMKKTKNVTKFFLVPKLGTQMPKSNVIDKENNPGIVITKKIKELGKFKQTNKLLNQKQVLKLITQIYDEKLAVGRDNPLNKELEMQIFSFNIFLNRYGIKKVAERKFTEFVLTVRNYSQVFRISVFAKMINILDSKVNYTVDEMKKYLEGFEYLTEICTSGTNIPHDPADIKRYVPFLRGLEFIRVFSENKLSHEEIADLRKELDTIKEIDPKNINKNGIIDMDIYLTKILTRYRHIMNRTKTYVVNAFNACDLDGNKMCNLNEFVLLYRHIEKEKFNEEVVVKLFEDQADLITDSQKNMSFDKFTAICVDYHLFSDVQQIKYLGVSGVEQEIQKKFDDLNLNWNVRKMKIDGKLIMLKSNLDKEDYDNWRNILEALELRVLKKEEGMEVKPILIAYKIMEDELERNLKRKEEMEEYEEVDVEEDD